MDSKTKNFILTLSEKEGLPPPSEGDMVKIVDKYRKLIDISLFVKSVSDAKEVFHYSLKAEGFDDNYISEYLKKFEVYMYIYFIKVDIQTISHRAQKFETDVELSPVVSSIIEMMPDPSSIVYDEHVHLFYEFIDYIRHDSRLIVFINNPSLFMRKNQTNESHKNAISTLMKL